MKEVQQQLDKPLQNLDPVMSLNSEKKLESALSFPKEEISLTLEKKNIMSVLVPVLDLKRKRKEDPSSIYPYGYLQTTAELDDALQKQYEIIPELLKLAEVEKSCQLMADEIEKTRRRVNALEYKTIPELEETIYYIEMKLDENERSTITRLIKVKDLIDE